MIYVVGKHEVDTCLHYAAWSRLEDAIAHCELLFIASLDDARELHERRPHWNLEDCLEHYGVWGIPLDEQNTDWYQYHHTLYTTSDHYKELLEENS